MLCHSPASSTNRQTRLDGNHGTRCERATELLLHLKVHHAGDPANYPPAPPPPSSSVGENWQMSLFTIDQTPAELREIEKALKAADPDHLSPRDAHELLCRLRAMLG